MEEILSKGLFETEEFAKKVASRLTPLENQATIIALSGNLGSGKTAFTQMLAKIFGVTEAVTSPTFVIIKTYNLQQTTYNKLVHIDAYRLKNKEELEKLGWGELVSDPKNLILIEWPENVIGVIPKNSINIKFEFVDENTRKITLL